MRRLRIAATGGAVLLSALVLVPAPARAEGTREASGRVGSAPSAPAKTAQATSPDASKHAVDAAREALRREVAGFGLVAIVRAAFGEGKTRPASPWESNRANATLGSTANAGIWERAIDDANGSGGLQLALADDTPAPAAVVPRERIATIGGGDAADDGGAFAGGRGHVPGAHVPRAPLLRAASVARSRIAPEMIQRVVHQSFGQLRLCYERGLRLNPGLAGRVAVKFTIDPSGAVSVASDGGSDLPDATVVACVVRGFASLTFPELGSGVVTVVYPLAFTPFTPP